MNRISSYLVIGAAILFTYFSASAQEDRFEAGIGAGNSNVIASSTFKDAVSKGDNQSYWLGYGFDENWGFELGLDHFDFDSSVAPIEHEAITLSGVYRFIPNNWIHPIVKVGFGSITSKAANGVKISSLGAKIMAGAELDFKYASIGAGVNYHYISKVGDVDELKNAQVYVPMIFITFHSDNSSEGRSSSSSTYSSESE